jgi:hypothetical protein
MQLIQCKNCETEFQGNFCPQCGQSAHEHEINARYILHDVPHSVLHIDKGFFYTLFHLLRNPGKTLREYLAGKRVKHFKPFAFVIMLSTICTLLIKGLHHLMNLHYQKTHPNKAIAFSEGFFAKYPSTLIFLLIPLLSLVTWLFYRKRKYSYWEHFLVNTYIAAYVNIFLLALHSLVGFKYFVWGNPNANYTVFMTLFMTYYGFAFGGLMHEKNMRLRNFLINFSMIVFLTFIYMTAFSLSGLTGKWWQS